ncbi:MAG TPA: DMT family transporter [Gaiellaceae bacterium]|jgi:drug/metabolite transporter (DMT)-like permease|nr:DMT family transporter [Gaiellaceae bacterium]
MTSATATLDLAGQRRRGRIYVALAALAWSSAGLFQRELTMSVGTQLTGRAFFAVLGLFAYVAIAEHGAVARAFRAIGRDGLFVAALLAASSGAFIVALNYTTVANVLFMQALAPVLAAVLGTFVGEPVERRTWVAMAVALVGVGLMVGGPDRPSVLGLSISFFMSVTFAGVIVVTRHRRDVSMAPATCLSQALVFVFAAPFADFGEIGGQDLLLLAALGIGQIGLGLIFLTLGARLIPAAEVALITLLEIVLGPLWVWIALSEQPAAATLLGGAIVLTAVLIQVRGSPAGASVQPAP